MENLTVTNLETTDRIFEIVDEGFVFKPTKVQNQNAMLLDRFEDDEDGTFPTVRKYINLVKKMDSEGASAFLDFYGAKKMKFNSGYATIERESKFSDKIKMTFASPIKMIFGYIGEEPIIKEISGINGTVTWEAFWSRNGRQTEYCNGIEVYLLIDSLF